MHPLPNMNKEGLVFNTRCHWRIKEQGLENKNKGQTQGYKITCHTVAKYSTELDPRAEENITA